MPRLTRRTGTIRPAQGSRNRRGDGQKVLRKDRAPLKDVKNEGRSGNVYENKGQDDKLPDTKDDICAWLHAILHINTLILQKPWAILLFIACWGTNFSLQNVETRESQSGMPC